jgi:hypothetical protein
MRGRNSNTRPTIANERLTLNRAGQVVLTLKTPYREGTTHIVMAPLEFMQRLAALIPRPRLHPIRFHGVLAPNARLHPEIIPTVPVNAHTPLSGPRRGAPCRSACSPELGPVAQAGVRDRPGTLPPLWRPLEDHRRHRTSRRDCEDLAHLGLPALAPPRSPARAFNRFQLA